MVLISSNFPKKELIFDSDRTITIKRHTLNIFLFIELVFKVLFWSHAFFDTKYSILCNVVLTTDCLKKQEDSGLMSFDVFVFNQ